MGSLNQQNNTITDEYLIRFSNICYLSQTLCIWYPNHCLIQIIVISSIFYRFIQFGVGYFLPLFNNPQQNMIISVVITDSADLHTVMLCQYTYFFSANYICQYQSIYLHSLAQNSLILW